MSLNALNGLFSFPHVVPTNEKPRVVGWLARAVITTIVWCVPVAAYAQEVLDSGARHDLVPSDFDCVADFTDPAPGTSAASADCENSSAEGVANVDVRTAVPGTFAAREVDARSAFEFTFRVASVVGATTESFVPIHVEVPINWAGFLFNDALSAGFGSAEINMALKLVDRDDLNSTVEQKVFLTASHNGVQGCVTVPTSKIAAGVMVVKCALLTGNRFQGGGSVSLSAVVEVGRTYGIVLEVEAGARKTASTTLAAQSAGSGLQNPRSLTWRRMTVEIGTDPAVVVMGLQEQIDELRSDLENHAHLYLTGRGTGHNNTQAETGAALLPMEQLDDMDGVEGEDDLCPDTPSGVDVDASGCGLDGFCSLQERSRDCWSADWLDDESRNPRDCRWRRRVCQAW